mgnify:CR=1 FL=1
MSTKAEIIQYIKDCGQELIYNAPEIYGGCKYPDRTMYVLKENIQLSMQGNQKVVARQNGL